MSSHLKVLVVDDVEIDLIVVEKLLEPWNFKVSCLRSGEDALALLRSGERFDLHLLDWNMPGVTGLDIVRHIHSEDDHGRIVMVTGENDMEHIQTAIDAGVDEYIMKPIDRETLQLKLELVGFPLVSKGA